VVSAALNRGVDISVLSLDPQHLPEEKAATQGAIVKRLSEGYSLIDVWFSEERLPWRGTFVDPA
jgi:hypothetical protein